MDAKGLQEFINAVGSIGEISGLIRDSLVRSGFTREEACEAVYRYIVATFTAKPEVKKDEEE